MYVIKYGSRCPWVGVTGIGEMHLHRNLLDEGAPAGYSAEDARFLYGIVLCGTHECDDALREPAHALAPAISCDDSLTPKPVQGNHS